MNVQRTLALSLVLLTSTGFASVSSAQGLTRAQVRADLVRLEKAGYSPSSGNDADYPANVLAAEAKVAASEQQQSQQANDAVGGSVIGTSASGTHAPKTTQSPCVGPVSFCDIYFGS